MISPYAKRGYVDHQMLSFDAYLKFIEDDFLRGQRLDPTHRRPAGPAARRARERADPRQPRARLRLHAEAAAAAHPAAASEVLVAEYGYAAAWPLRSTKDQELELDVESLAYGGNGVARLDGFVVFVRRGLPGDRVRARVTKVKRSHAEALATEVLRPGPQRVEAPCAHFPACGGCRFQDLAYDAQLAQKQEQVRDALQRIGGIAEPPLEAIVPCEPEIFHYRNKLEYSFTQTPDGAALGFHRAGRWDEVLEIEKCWLDDRPRQRHSRRRARLGARGRPRGVLAGGRQRLPAAPRRSRGPQHAARRSSSS